MFYAPSEGFPTADIARVYGVDEKAESNARTGCIGCRSASNMPPFGP